jgi:hypothetical protein
VKPQPPVHADSYGSGVSSPVHRRASDAYTEKLAALMATYDGSPIDVSFRELAGPLTVDESAQALHPYPARLLRHIPRFLLGCQQLVTPGDLVLDPFCGSGTVLTEAMRWGCDAWGLDINPLAVLISTVKTKQMNLDSCRAAALAAAQTARGYRRSLEEVPDSLVYWFGVESCRALQHLRRAVDLHSTDATEDFLALCLSLTVDAISHKDRRIPVPVRPRGVSLPVGSRTQTFRVFDGLSVESARRLELLAMNRPAVNSVIEVGDARHVESTPIGVPALVLTSPPYGAAQKYARSSGQSLEWLRLTQPGHLADLERQMIGREHLSKRTVLDPPATHNKDVARALDEIGQRSTHRAAVYASYFEDMNLTLQALANLTAPSSKLVIVSSDNTVAGQPLPTHKLVAAIAEDHGYRARLVLRDRIVARSMTTKRAKTAGMPIHHEYVHILQKATT